MYRDRLLIAGPLIATLVFGSIGTSHASVTRMPASAGDSHVVTTPKGVPPVCKSMPKGQKKICKNAYSDGFIAGKKCGPPRMTGKIYDDEAYDIGYNAGYDSGRRNCPS